MNRLAAIVVVACGLLGALIGFAVPMLGGSAYQSNATVVFTAVQVDDRPATASVARHIAQRMPSWAKLAGSGVVAGEFAVRSGEAITAHEISGVQSLMVSLTSPTSEDLPERATAAAEAVISVVVREETVGGTSRVAGVVTAAGSEPENLALNWAKWAAVLGGVLGALVGWLGCTLRRPGRWAEQVNGTAGRNRWQSLVLTTEAGAVSGRLPLDSRWRPASGSASASPADQESARPVSGARSREAGAAAFVSAVDSELRALVSGLRTRRGLLVLGVAFFAIAGYAATGSVGPPLLAVLVAGYAALRDARWIAIAVLVLGVTVLPPRLELVKIGPVTPTVLEVAVVIALAVLWRRRTASVLTGPLVLVTAAVAIGCALGVLRGGEFSEIADAMRALLLVPLGFVIVCRAFAGKLPQLVAMVAVGAATASAIELMAAVAGWERLLVDERSSVITGEDTTEVSRLSAPVLPLWAPLLILLFSGAFPTKPRWRLLLLAVPGLAHEALSFNRSTWAPLLGCVVVVAIARFGSRGVVKRLIVAAALGALALGLASGGVLGKTGEALAGRVTSLVSGEALTEDSLADRVRENTAAMATLRASPLTGTGVGVAYGGEIIWYDDVHDRTMVEVRPWIHNQYLRMWLWFGAFGLLAVGLLMVRTGSVVVQAWRQRAPGAVPAVAFGLGLACLALQSIFQTTLIDRPSLVTIALILAMLGLSVSWRVDRVEQGTATPLRAGGIMTK
ncbi:MAG: O-antigen ligase family protein [Kibdelosporangium sp.]